jgi:hypothetical protein
VRRRYPLESLRSLRQGQVDQSTTRLAAERQRLEASTRARERAEHERQDEEERARRVRALERDRMAHGALRAGDLEQARQWARGAEDRARGLHQAEARACSEERSQEQAVECARAELAQAEANAQAVERHRERWNAVQAGVEERSEEEQAMDGWTVRHLRPSGRGKERS